MPEQALSQLIGLARLHVAGKPRFFGSHAGLAGRAAFDAFLQPLRRIDWVVFAKEPFAGPRAGLAYLSHYTHRAENFKQPPAGRRLAAASFFLPSRRFGLFA